MGVPVVNLAVLKCSFGAAPVPLTVTPDKKVLIESQPAANIMDFTPGKNIAPFGTCSSMANPAVATATAAALGALTPQPCTPSIPAPWTPGSPTVLVANMPILNKASVCMCAFAGVITIDNPGATKETVP